MRNLLIAQSVWSLLALLWAGYLAWAAVYMNAFVALLAAAAYIWVAMSLFRGARWAWWLSIAVSAAVTFYFGPVIVYNLFAFLSGQETYSDSPGTIFVVLGLAFLTLVPAITVLWLLILMRHAVPPNPALQQDAPTSGAPLS